MRWGKSKCGATVLACVAGVAPLLILLSVGFFIFCLSVFLQGRHFFTMTANVLQLKRRWRIYAPNFIKKATLQIYCKTVLLAQTRHFCLGAVTGSTIFSLNAVGNTQQLQ